MILTIDTTKKEKIALRLKEKNKNIDSQEKKVNFNQADKLLEEIGNFFKSKRIEISQLKKIKVNNRGGSFTSLRIGVVVANALAYALGIEVEPLNKEAKILKNKEIKIVKPEYGGNPNITQAKKRR